jgi:hypothetical protein
MWAFSAHVTTLFSLNTKRVKHDLEKKNRDNLVSRLKPTGAGKETRISSSLQKKRNTIFLLPLSFSRLH